jgi:hypothetical protein
MRTTGLGFLLSLVVVSGAWGQEPPAPTTPRTTADRYSFFEKKIRPVLVAECYKCHSAKAEKVRGGFLLDTREGIRKGGDLGPGVVPGKVAESLVIQAIRQEDILKMPPKKKLPDAVIADFERWVADGASDPRDGIKVVRRKINIEKGRQFWAFQPPKHHTPPEVKDGAWPKSDIDRFLLAALEEKGLAPVADADRYTLIRRLYFDLIGLPPTPEEVKAFVEDTSSQALARVVDHLLDSPRFGERWGRYWLDVARFAETTGGQTNFNYPHAWRYRDYVIASFNADKPYDRFVKEQIAGDLLPADNPRQRAEQRIATGFLAIGPKTLNERNPLQFQMDVVDEQIDTMSQAILGITVACARCHDHKFDPIPQHDYYAIAGIFRSVETFYGTIRVLQSNHPSRLMEISHEAGLPDAQQRLSPQAIARLERQLEDVRNNPGDRSIISRIRRQIQIATLQSRLDSYEKDGTPKQLAMGVRDRFFTNDSPLFQRGEIDKPGEIIPRGGLQVVSPPLPKITEGSGRLELAEWMASRDNPLTARVMANRVWLHLFGRGIVATPDNFGAAGYRPSHPELLDHLALSFMDNGWSVKKLIRQIVLSRAYQLSSQHNEENYTADPENVLVWRMSKRRLDAESLRDALLSVSGNLDLTPPVASSVALTGEGFTRRFRGGGRFGRGAFRAPENYRSVYLAVMRDGLPESQALFDAADPYRVVGERSTTTVPSQALYLMNNPFVLRQAEGAARRVQASGGEDAERVQQAYLLFFSRPATEEEVKLALNYLATYKETAPARGGFRPPAGRRGPFPGGRFRPGRRPGGFRGPGRGFGRGQAQGPQSAWGSLCQALLGSADFLYVN